MGEPGLASQLRPPGWTASGMVTVNSLLAHQLAVDVELGAALGAFPGGNIGLAGGLELKPQPPRAACQEHSTEVIGHVTGTAGPRRLVIKGRARAGWGLGSGDVWWGYVDLNHGPLPYQGSALTG
jgi:hypothetical protein